MSILFTFFSKKILFKRNNKIKSENEGIDNRVSWYAWPETIK